MDYIVPATCTDLEFRQMWAEFEWENKVSVNTTLSDLREYLAHLLKSTNMRCLTPEKVLYFKLIFPKKMISVLNKLLDKIKFFFRRFPGNVVSWLQICMQNRYLVRMHWQICPSKNH